MVMNYGVNRTASHVHTLCQFIDGYPQFLSNQLINLCNCVGGDCTVVLAQSWMFFATITTLLELSSPTANEIQCLYTAAIRRLMLASIIIDMPKTLIFLFFVVMYIQFLWDDLYRKTLVNKSPVWMISMGKYWSIKSSRVAR